MDKLLQPIAQKTEIVSKRYNGFRKLHRKDKGLPRYYLSINGCNKLVCRKTLGRGLGLSITTEKPFLEVTDLAQLHIKEILDEMCDDAKHQMKQLSPEQIGSWSRTVTCSDGCWLIWGRFSQNYTFVIKNLHHWYSSFYGHLSMRGTDRICDEELWEGTAKSVEGHLSQILWAKAK